MDAEACDSRVCVENEKMAHLSCGRLKVDIALSRQWHQGCILTFYKNEKIVLRTCEDSDTATRYMHVEGEHYRTRISFESRREEHIYGLGQEQQDYFDRKMFMTAEGGSLRLRPSTSILHLYAMERIS